MYKKRHFIIWNVECIGQITETLRYSQERKVRWYTWLGNIQDENSGIHQYFLISNQYIFVEQMKGEKTRDLYKMHLGSSPSKKLVKAWKETFLKIKFRGQSRSGVSKLRPTAQLWPTTCFCKYSLVGTATLIQSHIVPGCFHVLQQQNCVYLQQEPCDQQTLKFIPFDALK